MNQKGFTFPEVIVSLAIFAVLAAMGLALFGSAITSSRADSQVKRVVGALQLARETAITRQRDIELRFDEATGVLRLVRIEEDEEIVFMELALENGVRFERDADVGDVPEGFGGEEGVVAFGDAERILFISDGSLVDQADVPLNGAIFLAVAGQAHTARAISVTGATAKARSYRWINDAWTAQ